MRIRLAPRAGRPYTVGMTDPTTTMAQYLYLLDEAFEGGKWHSLLGNLRSVTPADWDWVPPGGRRTIRDIVRHVAGAKFMYHHFAFGDPQQPWVDPEEAGTAPTEMEETIAWLRAAQEQLRASLAALSDADLLTLRRTHLRVERETRWIIGVMIQHDLYHSGEINHIRALHQGDDY